MCRFRNGLYFFFSSRFGVCGLFLLRVRHVTRSGLAGGFRFRAFEGDDFLGHVRYSLVSSRLGFFFFAFARFFIGQAEERGDRLPDARSLVLLLELRLAFDGETGERNRLEARVRDRFARHLALAVGAELDALERLVDFVKRVLFLREQAEREIAIVGIAPGIGLVHAEGGGFAALGAGAKVVLGHARHGIDHGVAQLQELLLLCRGERIELRPLSCDYCR